MMEKKILKTLEEVTNWFISRKDVMSFDFETTGLNYMTMEPVGISFCDGERVCYIDLWENKDYEQISMVLRSLFSDSSILFVAHNIKFDIKCCRKFLDCDPTNIFCTYIGSYLLDENRTGGHGLKILAIKDLGIPESEVKKWETANTYGYHSETWYKYCFNDAIWAYKLYEKYSLELIKQELEHVFYHVEMPFVYVCVDMEINGVKVDMDELTALEIRARNKLIELEDRMFDCIGMKVIIQKHLFDDGVDRVFPVNFRSGPQLIKVIKRYCGISVSNVKKETLLELEGKHPFIDYLLDYKKVRKLYDAYIKPAFGLIDSDGRIRPSFGIVKTGRTNCRNPNLQQLPNLAKRFPDLNYRAIFIADNGCSLVGGDYSGQELRVLGEVSQDERIIDAFRNNYDLHLYTANFIFDLQLSDDSLRLGTKGNEEACKQYKQERYRAKNGVNFPIVYGSSEYGIARHMGVEVKVAKEWRRKFFELYPGVKSAMNDTKLELERDLEVRTMMGRKRRFPDYNWLPDYSKGKNKCKSRCVRQGFNFKIQGFSADQIKIASVKADQAGLKIIMIIHDEMVCESNNPKQDVEVLKDCMEHAISLSIPFVADCKIGGKYSELK